MARNPRRIHPFDFDGVQADSHAGRVQAYLAYEACFGDHFDRGLVPGLLVDCQGDEVLFLGGHPVPVLGEEAF